MKKRGKSQDKNIINKFKILLEFYRQTYVPMI